MDPNPSRRQDLSDHPMSRLSRPPNRALLHLVSALELGGSERMLVNLVHSFAQSGQISQVVVVMNDRVDSKLEAELRSTSVPVYFLGRTESSRNPKYLFDLFKVVRKHRIRVIHSHNPGSKYWSMLCHLARFKLSLVYTFHHTEISMNSLDVLVHNAVIDTTIAISPAVAAEAHTLGIKRIEQIDNGIPLSIFSRVSPPLPGPVSKVISVGRLSLRKKGQDILIRAIKLCVDRGLDVECILVGSPAAEDSQTLPMLRALASDLQLEERVHFLQGRSDIADLLAKANIFVLPSRHEGFGLALVEAMAAGLPVIASNIEGPADIITDGFDGLLFECGSPERLAEKISAVMRNPKMAEELRTNGLATSVKYDISVMRDRYAEIYKALADPC